MTGAQFEIRIDGTPRSYRDRKDTRWRPPQFRKLYDLLSDGVPKSKRLRSRHRSVPLAGLAQVQEPAAPAVRREAEGGLGKAPMTTLTLRMIKGDFIVTGPDFEPSNASPAARPETGAPSTIRHRRLKRSAAAVSGQRGSGLPIADARAGGKARDGEFA